MELLGGRVGLHDPRADAERLLHEAVVDNAAHAQMMQHIGHARMPTQHALCLLRSCVAPQVGYVKRVTSPDVSPNMLAAFGRTVVAQARAESR